MAKKFFVLFFMSCLNLIVFAQSGMDKYSTAMNFYNNKEYSSAFAIFNGISNDQSLDLQLRSAAKYYLGDCLLNLNQLDGAATVWESFSTEYHFSNFLDLVLYNLGLIYYDRGDYRKSREKLQLLLNDFPKWENKGAVCYWIAESYASEKKYFEAEEYFKKAISLHQNNKYIDYSIFSFAQLFENTADYRNAVSQYDELLAYYKNSPLAPMAQLRIGVCYFKLREYDSAVLELTDPLLKNLSKESQIEAKYFLANSFVRLKDYKNASAIYEELLGKDLNPDMNNKIKYSIAWVKFQTNEYDRASTIFDELSKLDSDSLAITSLYWSAECKRYLGDSKTANDLYKTFVEKYPYHPLASRAQLGKGTVYYSTNQISEAESSLLNATITGDDLTKGRAYILLGELRLNRKEYSKARDYFTQAARFAKNDATLNNRTLLGLGISEFYLNNISAALVNLEDINSRTKEFEKDKVNFYLAESYFAQGEYLAALKYYNQINPTNELLNKQTIFGKAYAYFNLKDFSNSIYYFNEFITKYKNDQNINDAKIRLADSYFGIKSFDKASVIYKELFSKDRALSNDDVAFYQYCQSLYKAGKSNEAIEEFKKLQQKFPRSKYADVSQYVVGWISFQQSNFSSSIANYQLLLSKYPNSALIPIAYYSIGDSYFNLGQYDSSIIYYSRVIEDYPNTIYILDAVNGIQYAYIAQDRPDNAVNFIDQFISENPKSKYSDQIFFKKGDIYYSLDNYEKAIQTYYEFVLKFPLSSLVQSAYYWIGKSAVNLKRENEAIENFKKVIERSSKSDIGISAAIELSQIYSNQKQFSEAIKVLDSAVGVVPTSNRVPELLFLRASAEVKENKLSEAYSTFDQIIHYYEGSIFVAKSKLELGILELQRKNYENAQQLFQELSEKRTDDIGAQAQFYYGIILFEQNKITDAITAFVRVRSAFSAYDEWYTKSLLRLGDCYVILKDKQQAREMYRAVINRHRTGEYSQEANKKLKQL